MDSTEIATGIRNSLHVIAFGVFALLVFGQLARLSTGTAVIVTLIIIVAVGALAEFLQFTQGNTPDINDIYRDLAGAVLVLAACISFRKLRSGNLSNMARKVIRIVAISLTAMIFVPTGFWLMVAMLNRLAAPMIVSFDKWWEHHTYFTVNTRMEQHAGISPTTISGGKAGQFKLSPDRLTGMNVLPLFSDWSEYRFLTFVAAMADGPETLFTVRIYDGERLLPKSETFSREFLVTQDPTVFRISLDELVTGSGKTRLDLTDIQRLALLAPRTQTTSVMVLDEIRLNKSTSVTP